MNTKTNATAVTSTADTAQDINDILGGEVGAAPAPVQPAPAPAPKAKKGPATPAPAGPAAPASIDMKAASEAFAAALAADSAAKAAVAAEVKAAAKATGEAALAAAPEVAANATASPDEVGLAVATHAARAGVDPAAVTVATAAKGTVVTTVPGQGPLTIMVSGLTPTEQKEAKASGDGQVMRLAARGLGALGGGYLGLLGAEALIATLGLTTPIAVMAVKAIGAVGGAVAGGYAGNYAYDIIDSWGE